MAEAVAANQESRRNVTIEITNLTSSYCLINPKVYLDNGGTHIPPSPTVRPLQTEVCNFTKGSGRTTGAVGVMTYDLYEKNRHDYIESVVIMFSVPFDYNVYKNWFGLGVYCKSTKCDEKLFKEMYYDKEKKEQTFVRQECNGSGITYEGNYLDIKGTMSPLGRAIMKVEIWDKLFSPPRNQRH